MQLSGVECSAGKGKAVVEAAGACGSKHGCKKRLGGAREHACAHLYFIVTLGNTYVRETIKNLRKTKV